MEVIIIKIPDENKIALSFPHYVFGNMANTFKTDKDLKAYIKTFVCEQIDVAEIKEHKEQNNE